MTTITIDRATVEQALECLKGVARGKYDGNAAEVCAALEAALEQQAEPEAYGYASSLAVAIWEKHYRDIAPQWKPLDDVMGVLTQIDNMTSGLTRLAQQAEPVEQMPVGWLESPHGAFRVNPLYKMQFPSQLLQWQIALYTAPPQRKPVEPVQEPAATVTECEACFTPDVCQLRGTCDYYTASQMRIAAPPQQAEPVTGLDVFLDPHDGLKPKRYKADPQIADRLARHGIPMPGDPK